MLTLQCQRKLFLFSVPEYTWTGKVANIRHTMIRATWDEMVEQCGIYQDADVFYRGQLIGRVSYGVFDAILV